MRRHWDGSQSMIKAHSVMRFYQNGEQSYLTIFSHVVLKYHSSLSRGDTSLLPWVVKHTVGLKYQPRGKKKYIWCVCSKDLLILLWEKQRASHIPKCRSSPLTQWFISRLDLKSPMTLCVNIQAIFEDFASFFSLLNMWDACSPLCK